MGARRGSKQDEAFATPWVLKNKHEPLELNNILNWNSLHGKFKKPFILLIAFFFGLFCNIIKSFVFSPICEEVNNYYLLFLEILRHDIRFLGLDLNDLN